MAEQGKSAIEKLNAAFLISVPMNIFEATKSIEKPYLNLMLNKHLCFNLQRILKRNIWCPEVTFPDLDLNKVYQVFYYLIRKEKLKKKGKNNNNKLILKKKTKTVREFDENFTSRHFGYKDAEHYYANATLHNKLHTIEVPLLCLSSADDPFQPIQGKSFFFFF